MSIGDSFSGVELFGEEVRREINDRLHRAVSAAWDTVTILTPVDRGFLRNSWSLTLNSPVYRDEESAGPGYKDDLRFIRAESVIYLTNGKSYAEHVNNGTSKMQANNMLEHAVTAAMGELDR